MHFTSLVMKQNLLSDEYHDVCALEFTNKSKYFYSLTFVLRNFNITLLTYLELSLVVIQGQVNSFKNNNSTFLVIFFTRHVFTQWYYVISTFFGINCMIEKNKGIFWTKQSIVNSMAVTYCLVVQYIILQLCCL